jgi:hypothetical protein
MMAAPFMDVKSAILPAVALLSLTSLATSLAGVSGSNNSQPVATTAAVFTADDFDWRETVPSLLTAATLPAQQGIKTILENSGVLRAYVATEIRAECKPDKNPCDTKADGSLAEEVTKRIDEIVGKEMVSRSKTAIVDYALTRQPFPFSEIAAFKSEKRKDAYIVLTLSDRSYSASSLQAKYGAPYDTDIFQWYSVYKYRLDSPRYNSKATFEIDPVDGAVMKVAISLKSRSR